jgi:hypothetical protein
MIRPSARVTRGLTRAMYSLAWPTEAGVGAGVEQCGHGERVAVHDGETEWCEAVRVESVHVSIRRDEVACDGVSLLLTERR